jgi:hypothetical protein
LENGAVSTDWPSSFKHALTRPEPMTALRAAVVRARETGIRNATIPAVELETPRSQTGHATTDQELGRVRLACRRRSVLGQDLLPHRQRILRGVRPARQFLEDLGHFVEGQVTVNGA